ARPGRARLPGRVGAARGRRGVRRQTGDPRRDLPARGAPGPRPARAPLRDGGSAVADLTQSRTLVVMEGDQTGQELLEEALRVLDPDVTGLPLETERHDLSLANRRR